MVAFCSPFYSGIFQILLSIMMKRGEKNVCNWTRYKHSWLNLVLKKIKGYEALLMDHSLSLIL